MYPTRMAKAAVAAAAVVLGVSGGAALAHGVPSPSAGTITRVEGTRSSGFHVRYYDGSAAILPALEKAVAECQEYHRRLERIRCRVRVRTWYRDLGDTKRAIRYARSE